MRAHSTPSALMRTPWKEDPSFLHIATPNNSISLKSFYPTPLIPDPHHSSQPTTTPPFTPIQHNTTPLPPLSTQNTHTHTHTSQTISFLCCSGFLPYTNCVACFLLLTTLMPLLLSTWRPCLYHYPPQTHKPKHPHTSPLSISSAPPTSPWTRRSQEKEKDPVVILAWARSRYLPSAGSPPRASLLVGECPARSLLRLIGRRETCWRLDVCWCWFETMGGGGVLLGPLYARLRWACQDAIGGCPTSNNHNNNPQTTLWRFSIQQPIMRPL